MKTSELIGAALDWAVAKCEGRTILQFIGGGILVNGRTEIGDELLQEQGFNYMWHPSTNWTQGGPIIEREKIWLRGPNDACKPDGTVVVHIDYWYAHINHKHVQNDAAPLIAAMRCYVASKLGDGVEISEWLVGEQDV